jgi:predicted ABC-type ATPase
VAEKNFYTIAGCNGAGKTTAAYKLFPHLLESSEFINADEITQELRKTDPDISDIAAGRKMLRRIDEIILSGKSFTIETTLASKSPEGIIRKAKKNTCYFTLLYF